MSVPAHLAAQAGRVVLSECLRSAAAVADTVASSLFHAAERVEPPRHTFDLYEETS